MLYVMHASACCILFIYACMRTNVMSQACGLFTLLETDRQVTVVVVVRYSNTVIVCCHDMNQNLCDGNGMNETVCQSTVFCACQPLCGLASCECDALHRDREINVFENSLFLFSISLVENRKRHLMFPDREWRKGDVFFHSLYPVVAG